VLLCCPDKRPRGAPDEEGRDMEFTLDDLREFIKAAEGQEALAMSRANQLKLLKSFQTGGVDAFSSDICERINLIAQDIFVSYPSSFIKHACLLKLQAAYEFFLTTYKYMLEQKAHYAKPDGPDGGIGNHGIH
jgi:hypothetical protein